MSKKSKKRFRTGQQVRSVYDPTHTFVIDKSAVPERIFHEKGSNRWWTKTELQHLGAPENPATSIRLNGKAECAQNARNASAGISSGLQIVAGLSTGPEERECLECGLRFQPARPWQKFHSEGCRRANWERARKGARLADAEVRAPQALAVTA